MAATKNKVNSGDILRNVMRARGYTASTLSRKMGHTLSTYVSNKVSADDMKLSTMVQLLREMDYRLVVEPVGSAVKEGAYVIVEEKERTSK